MSSSRVGRFLGLPYDWRAPTWERIRLRWWNPADRRLLTPKTFGWGTTSTCTSWPAGCACVRRSDRPVAPALSAQARGDLARGVLRLVPVRGGGGLSSSRRTAPAQSRTRPAAPSGRSGV